MVRVSDLYNFSIKRKRVKDYRGSEPYKRFTTVFEMRARRLVFVGGPHTVGSSRYIQFLNRLLATENPGFILLERPRDWTKGLLESNSIKTPKSSWHEYDWAVDFAKKHDIGFAGMDISDANILKLFISMRKEGMELGIAFWTLLSYYSLKRSMPKASGSALLVRAESRTVLDFLEPGARLHGLKAGFLAACRKYNTESIPGAVDGIVRYVVSKYVGKGPFLKLVNGSNLTAPYPYSKDCELGRISAMWHAQRDKAMIDSCVSALRKHGSVVAIAGTGHIMEMRPVLERELKTKFGSVKANNWDELHS